MSNKMSNKIIGYKVYLGSAFYSAGSLNSCLLCGCERVNKPLHMAAAIARGLGCPSSHVRVILQDTVPGMIVLDSGLCNRALLSAELLDLPIYKGDTISIRLFNLLNRFSLSSDYIDDVHIEYNKGL